MKEVIMQVASYSSDYPKAPIYVADLVRCKECKWRGIPTACPIDNFYAQRWTKDDDFCSYGERREDE